MSKKRSLLLKIKDIIVESIVDVWLRLRVSLIHSSLKFYYYDSSYSGTLLRRRELQLSWPSIYINITRPKEKFNRNEPTVSISFNMYTGITIYKDVDNWLFSVHILGFGIGIGKSEGL